MVSGVMHFSFCLWFCTSIGYHEGYIQNNRYFTIWSRKDERQHRHATDCADAAAASPPSSDIDVDVVIVVVVAVVAVVVVIVVVVAVVAVVVAVVVPVVDGCC